MHQKFIQIFSKKFQNIKFNNLNSITFFREIFFSLIVIYFINPKFSFSNQMIFIFICFIWLIFAFLSRNKHFLNIIKSKYFIFVCVFPFLMLIQWLFNFTLLNKHVLLLPFVVFISLYYFEENNRKIYKLISFITLIYIFIIIVVTLYKLYIDPDLVRLLARGDKNIISDIITPFTATYATTYSICMIGLMLFGLSFVYKKIFLKIFLILGSVFILLFLFKTAYTISLIIYILGILLIIFYYFWEKAYNKKIFLITMCVVLIILFLICYFSRNMIADFVLELQRFAPDLMQQRRIQEVARLIRNFGMESEGGMINRFTLYFLSLKTFFKNPFIGVGFKENILYTTPNVINPLIGNHSTVLDFLACYGVFSFFYILIIPIFYNKILKNKLKKNYFIAKSILIVFMFFSLINTSENIIFYYVMLIFIPFILLISEGEKRMKYALIGCGRISPNHIAAAIKNNLDIVAVCDIVKENMNELLNKFDISKESIKQYTDYKEMLDKEKPELVAIATESGLHAEIALYCIRKKIHCIIEKPIAMNMKDAREICEEAEKNNVVVCANHQNRFNKSIQKIHDAVENNKFGKILHAAAHVRWNRGKSYYDQAKWRGTWKNDGGCLMNQCIHNADLLRWLMGDEIDEVMAYTDNLNHDYIEAEDLGLAVIKFKNGSYGLFEGTVNVYPKNLEETLYIFGSTGTVKAGGKSVNLIEEWNICNDTEDAETVKRENSEQPQNVYGFGHNPLYADVIFAITNNTQPLVDAKAGTRALELILAIYQSAATGLPVKFPLGDVNSLDFVGRFDK